MSNLDFATADFFRNRALTQDPYAYYDWVREQGRVWREPNRGVVIISGFDEAIAELSERLGLAKGTVHGLLKALQQARLVEQEAESGKYQLGAALQQLLSREPVRHPARPGSAPEARVRPESCAKSWTGCGLPSSWARPGPRPPPPGPSSPLP